MKLIKIYSNNQIFKSIIFKKNISFILSDAHSVGKTKLLELIDYCLLKDKPEFLKLPRFKEINDLEFYLEIEINNEFITIKRAVNKNRKSVLIKKTNKSSDCMNVVEYDFSGGKDDAQIFLNNLLNFKLLNKNIDYRKYINYFLRSQDDQSDIFRLNKYRRSKDIDYKPVISNMLEIEGNVVKEKYSLEKEIEELEYDLKILEMELANTSKEYIEAELEAMTKIRKKKEEKYKKFDFYFEEHKISKDLVKNIENKIKKLNKRRNFLFREIDYIDNAQNNDLLISISDIDELFKELQTTFPHDIKVEYQNVIKFNENITKDRIQILKENKSDFLKELESIDIELQDLNEKRQDILSVLTDSDTMSKFKKLEKEIIDIEGSINLESNKLEKFSIIDKKSLDKENKEKLLKKNIQNIKTQVDKFNKTSSIIKLIKKFAKLIFNEEAIFVVSVNRKNNLSFQLKIANDDNFNNKRDDGNTFRKLLSFLFSIAILVYYRDNQFFKFTVLDSPFDGDIIEYQKGLYKVIEKISTEYDIQVILTTVVDEIKIDYISQKAKEYEVRFLSNNDKLIGEF